MKKSIIVALLLFKDFIGSYRQNKKALFMDMIFLFSQIPLFLFLIFGISQGDISSSFITFLSKYDITKYFIAEWASFILSLGVFWAILLSGRSRIRVISPAEYNFILSQPIEMRDYIYGKILFESIFSQFKVIWLLILYLAIPIILLNLPLWRLPMAYIAAILLFFYIASISRIATIFLFILERKNKKRILQFASAVFIWISIAISLVEGHPHILFQLPMAPLVYLFINTYARSMFPYTLYIVIFSIIAILIVILLISYLSRLLTAEVVTLLDIASVYRKRAEAMKVKPFDFSKTTSIFSAIFQKMFLDLVRLRIITAYKIAFLIVLPLSVFIRFLDLLKVIAIIDIDFLIFVTTLISVMLLVVFSIFIVFMAADDAKTLWIYRTVNIPQHALAKAIFIRFLIVLFPIPIFISIFSFVVFQSFQIVPLLIVCLFDISIIITIATPVGFILGSKLKASPMSGIFYSEEVRKNPVYQLYMFIVFFINSFLIGGSIPLIIILSDDIMLLTVFLIISVALISFGVRIISYVIQKIEIK